MTNVDTSSKFTHVSLCFGYGGLDLGLHAVLSDSELAEIRRRMVTTDNRTDELRLLGNGVVPAVAALAFRTLMKEIAFPADSAIK